MALVIPPGHYQATIPFKHDSSTRTAVITIGVRADAPDEVTGAELADEVYLAFAEGLLPQLDSNVVMGPVSLFTYIGGEGGSFEGDASGRGSSPTSENIASNTAALVRKVTGRPGRAGRGRMFIPWCVARNAVNDIGGIEAGTRNGLQTGMDAVYDAWNAPEDARTWVILHDDGIAGSTVPTLITSFNVDTTVGTQRRRLRG